LKIIVEHKKTLLVDGPASVAVISGKAEVFGFSAKESNWILIREGKRLPFAVKDKTSFEIRLGKNAKIEEFDGDTIPASWVEAIEVLRRINKRPIVVLVLGGVDSGKSSLCAYLINRLICNKSTVTVLDCDLGQTDIGPPCTVAYAIVTEPVSDLFYLKAENAIFVGFTSPSEDVKKTIESINALKTEVLKSNVDFVIVNTDGWVMEKDAVKYKLQLAENLVPDFVLGVQQNNELDLLLSKLEDYKNMSIDSAVAVKPRSKEKRKNMREIVYRKYLADAKVKTWRLSLLHFGESNPLSIYQNKENSQGLLLGLLDFQKRFLGIGILRGIDYKKGTLKVMTSVSTAPIHVIVGKVRLDDKLQEVST